MRPVRRDESWMTSNEAAPVDKLEAAPSMAAQVAVLKREVLVAPVQRGPHGACRSAQAVAHRALKPAEVGRIVVGEQRDHESILMWIRRQRVHSFCGRPADPSVDPEMLDVDVWRDPDRQGVAEKQRRSSSLGR